MHSVVFVDRGDYRNQVEKLVTQASGDYEKVCSMSFNTDTSNSSRLESE